MGGEKEDVLEAIYIRHPRFSVGWSRRARCGSLRNGGTAWEQDSSWGVRPSVDQTAAAEYGLSWGHQCISSGQRTPVGTDGPAKSCVVVWTCARC